jgi:hypothetical protein
LSIVRDMLPHPTDSAAFAIDGGKELPSPVVRPPSSLPGRRVLILRLYAWLWWRSSMALFGDNEVAAG